MFAAADWDDVPENVPDFTRVNKKKVSYAKNTEEHSYKRRGEKPKVIKNVDAVMMSKNTQKQLTRPKKAVKRACSAEKTESKDIDNDNGPAKKKKKLHKPNTKAYVEAVTMSKNTQKQLNTRPKKAVKRVCSVDKTENKDIDKNDKRPEKKKKKLRKPNTEALVDSELDEVLISKNKSEICTGASVQSKELEDKLFRDSSKAAKKEKIRNLLATELNRRSIKTSGNSLHERMMEKLKAAQFRCLNEKLYVSESKEAKELFSSDPAAFQVYHDGFRQQVKKWPVNPLEVTIKKISMMPKHTKVADLGCGEGMLARRVPQKVRSFDLVSISEGVEVCDMAHTPLLTGEMDVAVYCLSLMGTNLKEYLIEANRILKIGGLLHIAEVESRFQDVNVFTKAVNFYGFELTRVDDKLDLFYFFDFKKVRDLGSKRNKLPIITLNPCLYKKR